MEIRQLARIQPSAGQLWREEDEQIRLKGRKAGVEVKGPEAGAQTGRVKHGEEGRIVDENRAQRQASERVALSDTVMLSCIGAANLQASETPKQRQLGQTIVELDAADPEIEAAEARQSRQMLQEADGRSPLIQCQRSERLQCAALTQLLPLLQAQIHSAKGESADARDAKQSCHLGGRRPTVLTVARRHPLNCSRQMTPH